MSKHDVERAKARRAVDVSTKRMRTQANIKRSMTITVKAAVGTAAVAAGAYAANRYLENHNVTVNGKRVRLGSQNIWDVVDIAKKARDIIGFIY